MQLSEADAVQIGFLESPAPQLVLQYRRIAICNRALERLFGYDRADLLGQSVRKLYPSNADFQRIGERGAEWLRTHDSYEDERFMQARDGVIFWARARGVTLTPDQPFALTVWTLERLAERIAPPAGLTPREKEVAYHIANGKTSKEVGRLVGISPRTVEVHRARLMKKLAVRNIAELVSAVVNSAVSRDMAPEAARSAPDPA